MSAEGENLVGFPTPLPNAETTETAATIEILDLDLQKGRFRKDPILCLSMRF